MIRLYTDRVSACFFIVLCVLFLSAQGVSAAPPEVSAQSAYVVDVDTGIVLYSKNEHEKLYPASITKLMTILLALEYANGDYKQDVEFYWSSVAGTENTSHIGMKPGEVIPLEEALHAVLLHSANECANAVAELVAGSQAAFAEMMTERARELGCLNTNFKNPHGLHDEEHYTTAYDMSLIMREVIKHPDFIRISSTTYYEVQPTELTDEVRPFSNTNRLIRSASEYYNPLIVCGKTGYTDQSRHTLVTLAENNGARLVTVVMKTPQYGIYTDTTALVDYAFGLYEDILVFEKDSFAQRIPVKFGEGLPDAEVSVAASADVMRFLPYSYDPEQVQREVFLPVSMMAPVYGNENGRYTKEHYVGYIRVYYGKYFLATVDLYIDGDVLIPDPLLVDETEAVEAVIDEETDEVLQRAVFLVIAGGTGVAVSALIAVVFRFKRRKNRYISGYNRYV